MAVALSLAGLALAAFLALILARASWHKLADHYRAVGAALDYEAVPESWVPHLVRGLAVTEAAAALALVAPLTRPAGALAAAALFAGYALLMARALGQGRTEIDCGCGGAPQPISPVMLVRNGVLAALALATALLPAEPVGFPGMLIAVAAALTLLASYGLAEKLASHLPHVRAARAT